jgi:hypothetical protein
VPQPAAKGPPLERQQPQPHKLEHLVLLQAQPLLQAALHRDVHLRCVGRSLPLLVLTDLLRSLTSLLLHGATDGATVEERGTNGGRLACSMILR